MALLACLIRCMQKERECLLLKRDPLYSRGVKCFSNASDSSRDRDLHGDSPSMDEIRTCRFRRFLYFRNFRESGPRARVFYVAMVAAQGIVVPRARVSRARCQFVSHCTRTMLTIFNTGRNQFAKHATRWFLYCAILPTFSNFFKLLLLLLFNSNLFLFSSKFICGIK